LPQLASQKPGDKLLVASLLFAFLVLDPQAVAAVEDCLFYY
jgi:hypothetical protein